MLNGVHPRLRGYGSRSRRGERDVIKFIDFRFEIGQFLGLGKGRRQDVP